MRGRDVAVLLVTLLALSGAGAAYVASQIDATLSGHGWLALGLGIGATVALTVGLLGLIFWSHRRGYDDDAGHL